MSLRPGAIAAAGSRPPADAFVACRLRAEVETLRNGEHLDAFVYPSWNNPPRLLGDLNTPDGSNGPRIASVVGFPAITVPTGYVRNAALPVGLEILGGAWSPRLVSLRSRTRTNRRRDIASRRRARHRSWAISTGNAESAIARRPHTSPS